MPLPSLGSAVLAAIVLVAPVLAGPARAADRPYASNTWVQVQDDALLCSRPDGQGQCARFRLPGVEVASGQNLAGDEIWVAVRDNGPGIPAEALPRIFSPFFTTKEGGTGLGLALAKKTAEAHGGTLEAGARRSGGAELLLVLPRAARRGAGEEQA